MRSRYLFAALAVIAVVPAHADNQAVKNELSALFSRFAAALRKKDSKTALSFYAPDFTARENGRTVTRREVAAQMEEAVQRLKHIDTLTWDIDKLKVKGSVATAEAREVLVATVLDVAGNLGPKGRQHRIRDVSRTRDVFVKTAGGWLLKQSETLSETVMVDGKKITPPAGR